MNPLTKLAIAASIAGTVAVNAAAGTCNYSVDFLAKQLPFPIRKDAIKIVKEEPLTGSACILYVSVKKPYGKIYASVVAFDKGLIIGSVYENKRNITKEKVLSLQARETKKKFGKVKGIIDKAVMAYYKPKNANGKIVYAFVDPFCPFCEATNRYLKRIANQSGYTIALIPTIVHGQRAEKAVDSFICSNGTFDQYVSNSYDKNGKGKPCQRAVEILKNAKEVTQELGIRGTPAYVTSDGKVVFGANMPALREAVGLDTGK